MSDYIEIIPQPPKITSPKVGASFHAAQGEVSSPSLSLFSQFIIVHQSGPDDPLHGNRGPEPQGAVEQAGGHRRPQVEFLPSSIILSCSSPVFNLFCVCWANAILNFHFFVF